MNNRENRINSEDQKELANLISYKLKDPRLKDCFVSVLDADVSKDLSVAKIKLSVFPDDKKESCFNAIKSAIPFLRRELAKNVNLRIVPELRFELDKGYEHENKINQLLKEIKNDKKD